MHCRFWASPCFFFLVTFLLSHRHLALAALLPMRSSSSSSEEPPSSATAAYSVAWSGPAPGDRFGSGDTIVGEWQVTPQDQKVVSPSFRLCVGGEDGCGATIWPEVVEESEGSYYVSLTAPSVTTESGYYLQMKDDFGHTYSSPIFNIASTPQKKNKPAAHSPDVAQPRPDQAPMSSSPSSTGTKSKGATDSNPNPAAAEAPADPKGILPLPSAASSLSPNPTATLTPGSNGGNGNGNGNGNGSGPQVAAAAHNAPPAAAIAVPLSLTGAIILLAGGLALHHRRQLAAEKERAIWSSSSWPWNKGGRSPALDLGGGSSSSSRDVEKALFFARAGALFRGGGTSALPDPTRAHDDVVYHGRFPERAAPVSSFYSPYAPSGSSYACSAPEPRQRTRDGLELLTREFTTRPRPRSCTRAHPSPSPSSYRGLWDRRYTLRRSTRSGNYNNNTNTSGGGSLWRSLSFAARHKKVLPPVPVAPPSVLNSPAMTVATTSVTSEVLPSYLPSPQFDGSPIADQAHGSGEHGATTGVGDFEFENVPLSPPLPAPLHTRGEAADPDDSRMKELRGVYEAVARALGSTHGV